MNLRSYALLALFACAIALCNLGCVRSNDSVVQASRSVGEWRTLVDGQSFEGWQAQDPSRSHDWQTAQSVSIDPSDKKEFAIEPGTGLFVNVKNDKSGKTQNMVSEELFGDVETHVEFVIPHDSNSGVFLMGLYEVQVEDSFGKTDLKFSDCGGFYARKVEGEWIGGTPPLVNACTAPGN